MLEWKGKKIAKALEAQQEKVKEELRAFNPQLLGLPKLVVVNKQDLLKEAQIKAINSYFKTQAVLLISAATGQGVEELRKLILSRCPVSAVE
jgi:50S ribosomal subunit-associated GTPase HflX